MWSLIGSIISGVVGGFFKSLFSRLFPPKTAADQQVVDLKQELSDEHHAEQISEQVDKKPISDVQSDLNKLVRDPSA